MDPNFDTAAELVAQLGLLAALVLALLLSIDGYRWLRRRLDLRAERRNKALAAQQSRALERSRR